MEQHIIGIDLGGSKIEVIRCRWDGTVEERLREPLGTHGSPEQLWEQIARMVRKIYIESVVGVGLAHPGFVDTDGVLRNCPNIPYLEGIAHIGTALEAFVHLPVKTDNDANSFALAEYYYGVGRGTTVLMGIVWGTGIGGGAVIDGNIVRGGFGGGMEIGRTVLGVHEPRDVEAYCTGLYPIERYYALGGTKQNIDRVYLFEEYQEDAIAALVRQELLHVMAQALANWTYVLQPEIIVMGGGVSNSSIYEDLRLLYTQKISASIGSRVRILPHSLGDAAGALGAASLFLGA